MDINAFKIGLDGIEVNKRATTCEQYVLWQLYDQFEKYQFLLQKYSELKNEFDEYKKMYGRWND